MPAPTIIAAVEPLIHRDRAPVDLAVAIADTTGAQVIAAAAFPWAMDDERERLEALRHDLGVQTRPLIDLSAPRSIHTLASDLDAGLIVVGSTQRGAVGRVLTGSTAEAIVHGSPCPVLLAPKGYTAAPLKTIAVGFADTPEGHAALATAHAFACRAGAHLRVIAALAPMNGLAGEPELSTRPRNYVRLEGRHRAEVEAALNAALAQLDGDLEIETEFHVADAADILLRVSEHVDLLVCGSRGYGPTHSVLVGGVTHRLLRAAACPVLVLPRGVEQPLAHLIAFADAATAQ